MTEKQLIAKLIELQEHPEQLSDEQLQQILNNKEMRELVEQMVFTKRAFVHEELKNKEEAFSVEDEWAKFVANHHDELYASDDNVKPHSSFFTLRTPIHKIAASFIGILLASGIAFATIHIVRNTNSREWQTTPTEKPSPIESTPSLSVDTIKADTIPMEPKIFNNVTLEQMLTEIANAYHVGIDFQNDEVRALRFHFVWKREDSLVRIVEKLNTFETVNIAIENEKLIVR